VTTLITAAKETKSVETPFSNPSGVACVNHDQWVMIFLIFCTRDTSNHI